MNKTILEIEYGYVWRWCNYGYKKSCVYIVFINKSIL